MSVALHSVGIRSESRAVSAAVLWGRVGARPSSCLCAASTGRGTRRVRTPGGITAVN